MEIIYHAARLSNEKDLYQVKFGKAAHRSNIGNVFFQNIDGSKIVEVEDNIRKPHKEKKSKLMVKAAKKLIRKKGYSKVKNSKNEVLAELKEKKEM